MLENCTATCKRKKLEHFLKKQKQKKNNSKWIKDINIRPETIKLLEENISRILFEINYSNICLDLSPKAKEMRAKINKWNLIKLKSF